MMTAIPPDGILDGRHYTTGTGTVLDRVHSPERCVNPNRCAIHGPSSHVMRMWPTDYDDAQGCMVRICPHGVCHHDPDDAEWRGYVIDIEGPCPDCLLPSG